MEQPRDEHLYAQLLGHLAAEGGIEEDPEADGVLLTEFGGRVLDQPLRLRVTPSSLARHLRTEAPDATGLYPDVAPVEAAWRLFTVHLDEAVQTARPGETDLVLVPGGVASRRPDGTRTPLPPDVEEHIALNDYYERLVQHCADRGETTLDAHREVVTLHSFDGRVLDPALRLEVPSEEMRRQMRAADDPEATWSAIVGRIDQLAAIVDPREVELVLTPDGVIGRRV